MGFLFLAGGQGGASGGLHSLLLHEEVRLMGMDRQKLLWAVIVLKSAAFNPKPVLSSPVLMNLFLPLALRVLATKATNEKEGKKKRGTKKQNCS